MNLAVADAPRERAASAWRECRAESDRFPQALRVLSDAPSVVWACGAELPAPARAVAIVGSRQASPYGRARARDLASALARVGVTVVSGLARGVDAEAHEGALQAGGATVAVMPGPPGEVTPPAHASLADRIAARGTLLTEVPPGESLTRARFAKRNRLIAALAGVTVVVEAAESSGALITAEHACRLGRALLAVPGDIDRPTARGTLQLLRDGARPCGDASDVLAALERGVAEPRPRVRRDRTPATAHAEPPPATTEARVFALLAASPCTVDALAARAGLDTASTLAALQLLEWSALARREAGGRWRSAGPRR